MNKQRVCLLIDFEIYKKLRDIQADKIKKTKRSVTFSQTVEDLVKIGIKNGKANMNSKESQNYVVRYKFKGKSSIYVKILTLQQFENLKQDSEIEYSEIVN